MLFWYSNLLISFIFTGYWTPDIFNLCWYSWYFETLSWWFLHCTGCNDAKMNHRKSFSSLFLILTHLRFVLSSFGNGKSLDALMDHISPALKRKTKLYKKNVNLDDKKSSHSVKKLQTKVKKWQNCEKKV